MAQVQILTLPLTGCVTLSNLLNLSMLSSSHMPVEGKIEDQMTIFVKCLEQELACII